MKPLRIAICALLVFGVLAHGGVEEWALAVFETSAGLLFFLWALFLALHQEREVVLPSILRPLLVFAAVVAMQWILRRTASPYDTRVELQLLLADIVLVFLAAQAFRTLQDWRDFLWFVMLFSFFVSGFGILQHLTFNGKLYWFRELRYGGIPFGPYVNRNHFAGLAELVLPLALVPLFLGRVRRERLVIVGILAVIPLSAILLAASRGGIISLFAELTFLVLVVLLRRAGGRHLYVGGAVLLLAFASVS